MKNKRDFMTEWLQDECSYGDILTANREYCDENRYDDDYIYDMNEFDDLASGLTPTELVDSLDDGFSTRDNFFKCDYHGYRSFDCLEDEIDFEDLADFIIEHPEKMRYCDDITGGLESFEEQAKEEMETVRNEDGTITVSITIEHPNSKYGDDIIRDTYEAEDEDEAKEEFYTEYEGDF